TRASVSRVSAQRGRLRFMRMHHKISGNPTPAIPTTEAIARCPREASPGATVTVSVEVAVAPPLTVTEAGLKAQLRPTFDTAQYKSTVPLKPLTESTFTLKSAEAPALIVAVVGFTDGLKSHTCN